MGGCNANKWDCDKYLDCDICLQDKIAEHEKQIKAEAIDEFAEKLADCLERNEVDFPDCKNVSICTLDRIVEQIFEVAEQVKEQDND